MYKIYAIMLMIFLTSCTTIDNIKKLNISHATPFGRALAKEYKNLADAELQNRNWTNYSNFKLKSKKAGKGEEVLPENLAKLNISEADLEQLIWARGRLYNLNIDSIKAVYPDKFAHMQQLFDCWAVRAASNSDKEQIEECRMDFVLEIASFENILMPLLSEKDTLDNDVIHFALNSYEIDADGMQFINNKINVLKNTKNYLLKISGYTDSSGDDSYNMALSRKRAKEVANKFIENGINENAITQSAYGETSPVVATAKGAYQKLNRRVEIEIKSEK